MTQQSDFINPSDTRLWIQRTGSPGRAYEYVGCGEITETEISVGEREVVLCQSKRHRGRFDIVGQKTAVPELSTTTVRMYLPPGAASFLEKMADSGCPANFQVVEGKCSSADEFNTKWRAKALYSMSTLGSLTISPYGNFMGDNTDPVTLEGPMQVEFIKRIFPIRFSERAGDEVLAEALDGIFAGIPECGACGPYSEGCDHFYVITRANTGSPGLSGQLVYTNDGVTFTAVDIPTLGGLDPSKIAEVGDFLVVISEAAGNHQYARRQEVIAAGDWVEVTTGYVAFHGPRAIYVKSPGEVFIAAAAGYVYKSEDYQNSVSVIEAGVLTTEDFNDIDGDGAETVVAVGDNNTVIASTNSGETFAVIAGPQAGADLQAIAVVNEYIWIVGGDAGAFYYTDDGGTTWNAITYQGAGAGAIIHDIDVSEQSTTVMAAVIEIGGVGYAYRSTDHGVHWYRDVGVSGLGANDRLNFVDICPNDFNVMGVGGLADGTTDGYVAIAE